MIGGVGAATSVLWMIGIEAFPSCLVVIATTTILYSVKGPEIDKNYWSDRATVTHHLALTQFLQRVIMNARIASHAIFRVIFRHSKMGLIEWCVIDSIHEIRTIWLVGFEPRDFDGCWCHFVYSHVSGMWWNCKARRKRRRKVRISLDMIMTF